MTDQPLNPDAPSVRVPTRPAMAVPPRPLLPLWGSRFAGRPSLWAWPLVLSLLLFGCVMVWLRAQEVSDLDRQRADMISDALSLEAYITNSLEDETAKLRALAEVIQARALEGSSFADHALVLGGLRRFWVSVTWLGDDGQIMAHLPGDALPVRAAFRYMGGEIGMAGHLSVSLLGRDDHPAGMLVARYSAGALLRQKVPWWLASKYDIRLVDASDNVIAATVDGPRHRTQAWSRVSMSPIMPNAWLELAARERIAPWWRTMPMALMGGFAMLLAIASFMLRRQMQRVSRAEESWRTQAAWRSAMEDSLAVGIQARDLQGRLVYVNKTMADMVGYQPADLIGHMPPMPYWVPQELEQSMSRLLRNVAANAPLEGYEARWQHRDGHLVEVMVFESPLVDAKGIQIGWMASVLNVTDPKRLQ
jgi:two-component system sensor histidine kinase DctS